MRKVKKGIFDKKIFVFHWYSHPKEIKLQEWVIIDIIYICKMKDLFVGFIARSLFTCPLMVSTFFSKQTHQLHYSNVNWLGNFFVIWECFFKIHKQNYNRIKWNMKQWNMKIWTKMLLFNAKRIKAVICRCSSK